MSKKGGCSDFPALILIVSRCITFTYIVSRDGGGTMKTALIRSAATGAARGDLGDGFDWARGVTAIGKIAGTGLNYALRGVVASIFLTGRWLLPRQEVPYEEVPPAEPSLATAAKIALDELGYASEVLFTSVITVTERHRIALEALEALSQFAREGWLDDPGRYHQVPPPLESPQICPARALNQTYEHLRFESGYAPHPGEPGRERWLAHGPNRTAHAWVLRHSDYPRPWLVCIPGYRMGAPLIDFAAFRAGWLHRRLGLNVVIPVLPFHGPRSNAIRTGAGFFDCDYMDTIHALTQGIWDIRRLISWIGTQDAVAIGAHGVSLGAYSAALLTSLDDRLDYVIAGMPPADLGRLIRWHTPPPARRLVESAGLTPELLHSLLRVISPLALTALVRHERRFIYGGIADQLVPPDHARDLWRHWDRPAVHWYAGGHMSFWLDPGVHAFVEGALRTSNFAPSPALAVGENPVLPRG